MIALKKQSVQSSNCWSSAFDHIPCPETGIVLEISRKGWNGWHDYNDFELVTGPRCPQNPCNESRPYLVANRLLRVASGGDEELVLNVDKMLCILNDRDVCGLNRMLGRRPIAPLGATPKKLTGHWPSRPTKILIVTEVEALTKCLLELLFHVHHVAVFSKSLSEVLHMGVLFKSLFKAYEVRMLRLAKAPVLAFVPAILTSIICRWRRRVVSRPLVVAITLVLLLAVFLWLLVRSSRNMYQAHPTVSGVLADIVFLLQNIVSIASAESSLEQSSLEHIRTL